MRALGLLKAHRVSVDTPSGRPLFRDLTLTLAQGERVAIVGRNGVGKSSLIDVIAGASPPQEGHVSCLGTCELVTQMRPGSTPGMSPGLAQRRALEGAFSNGADLLLLDEPTHDLDRSSRDWLRAQIRSWPSALIVVSHHRSLLREFTDFFVVEEAGCRHFHGAFESLLKEMVERDAENERRYAQNLRRLLDEERRQFRVRQRRQRKKSLGRIHEIGRCPSRANLNGKRSYAQESQGRRAVLQRTRTQAKREWARATRRALSVHLPLELVLPEQFGEPGYSPCVLEGVAARVGERVLFEGLDLRLEGDRVAIVGDNGTGKSTLVEILVGDAGPTRGRARVDTERIGYIAQNSRNWDLESSLVEHVLGGRGCADLDTIAAVLEAHRFPFALATRPLRSLSPGERLRAALICIFQRPSAPSLLVLDEPTGHLDLSGVVALERVLRAWKGGLVVASHDEEFLRAIDVRNRLDLGAPTVRWRVESERSPSPPPSEVSRVVRRRGR